MASSNWRVNRVGLGSARLSVPHLEVAVVGLALRIGELAAVTGVPVETLRFYELEQVRFIRHCRSLDIGIDEIRHLLALRRDPGQSCLAVNRLLDEKLLQVDQRLRELQALQLELQRLRGHCDAPATTGDCGILQGLGEAAQPLV